MYAFYTRGEYHVPTGIILPLIDPKTINLINVSDQSLVTVLALMGTIGIEVPHLLAISTLKLMIKLTITELNNISVDLEKMVFI